MAGRIGELKVKPVAPSNLVPEQMPHESPKRRGQSGHHSIGNPTPKVEVNSDDSSSSFHLEAAVTTNAGCDDSNAFVQFTLGVEKPTSDSPKNSMNLGAVQEEKEEKEKMGTVDSPGRIRDPNVEATQHSPRARLITRSLSGRSLAEHLKQDKPSIADEVRKVLKIKVTRPGLGPRGKSERLVSRGKGLERQISGRLFRKNGPSDPFPHKETFKHDKAENQDIGKTVSTAQQTKPDQANNPPEFLKSSYGKAMLDALSDHVRSDCKGVKNNNEDTTNKPKSETEGSKSPPEFLKSSYGKAMLDALSDHIRADCKSNKTTNLTHNHVLELEQIPSFPPKDTEKVGYSLSLAEETELPSSPLSPRKTAKSTSPETPQSPRSPSRRSRSLRGKDRTGHIPGTLLSPRSPRRQKGSGGRRLSRTLSYKETGSSSLTNLSASLSEIPSPSISTSCPTEPGKEQDIGVVEIIDGDSDDGNPAEAPKDAKTGSQRIDKETEFGRVIEKSNKHLVLPSDKHNFLLKDFSKKKLVISMNGSRLPEESNRVSLQDRLRKATIRLQDAKRLVSQLEEEVAKLTEDLRKEAKMSVHNGV